MGWAVSTRTRAALTLAAAGLLAAACGGGGGGDATTPAAPAGGSGAPAGAGTPGVGITKDSVTIGTVASLTGPVPGIFQAAPYAVDAWAAMVNAQGGINGRQVKVQVGDDGMSCNQNVTATQDLLPKVFALVGSMSTSDGCSADTIDAAGIPYFEALPLDPRAANLKTNYAPSPLPPGWRTGDLIWFKQQFPDAITKVGSLYGNTPGGVANYKQQKAAIETLGYTWVYERSHALTETDFTADILRMKSAGVQFLYLQDEDMASQARILNAAQQQGWHPTVITGSGMYDGNFLRLVDPGVNTDNIYITNVYAMFLGEDRSRVKGVDEYLTWLDKAHPGAKPDLYGMFAFSAAKLFGQALTDAGPDPTRQSVLDAAAKIHNFDADGMVAPADVGAKKPPECWMLIKIENGRYVRTLPKDTGYVCDPAGYVTVKPGG